MSDAIDEAAGNDLGPAFEVPRGIELAFEDVSSAKIEWYVTLEPEPGEFLKPEWNNTVIRVGDVHVLDTSPTRELLHGWNYGPASIFLIDDNGDIGSFPPNNLFFTPGRGGSIRAQAI